MSGIMESDDGMDDLRDERLRRALAHAPDHAAAPDWRTRKAILDQAREAVAPSLAVVPMEPARSWWQRLLGLGGSGGGARMPWNAAFATVLVGVLVTVLWQREPVPGARPDGEPPAAATAARPAESPAAPPAAPAAAPPPAPVQAPTPAPVPAPSQPMSERALPSSQDIPGTPLPPPEPAPPAAAKAARPARPPERPNAAPAEPARRQAEEAALAASAGDSAKEARKRETPAIQPAPPPAMAAAPAPVTPPSGAAGAAASRDASLEGLRREAERSASSQRFAAPSGPTPGAARAANEPPRPAAAAAAAAAAPPAPRAAESSELPSFAALSQWNRMTITPRGGAGRSLSRREAMELNALLGSAALSAVGPQPLAGTAEWRVTLERGNGEVLATFELGRNQVRWREGQKPATTGAPSAASLAALRDALQHAVEPPAQPPALPWRPAQPPAEPETAPSR
ncbi:hypothetical protein A8M77_24740 [Variovorax sp. JS1663]|nr:hypothetical protein A8M77_24740 [Variovorax sp. JS1663]